MYDADEILRTSDGKRQIKFLTRYIVHLFQHIRQRNLQV